MHDIPPAPIDPASRARSMRTVILTQLFGVLGMQSFQNGVLLLYMAVLGISPVRIIIYLALPNGISMLLRLPVAYLSDRFGKKRVGTLGVILTALGFAFLPLAGFYARVQAEQLMATGIVVLAVGKMFFAASWHGLVGAIVPETMRGRFFGKQRLAFQTAGILFAGICSWLLAKDSPVSFFQIILAFLVFAFCLRIFFYRRVPELDAPRPEQPGFWPALVQILRTPGYASFCAYVFLINLFTAGHRSLFGLIEKNVMDLSSGQVVLLANIGAIVCMRTHKTQAKATEHFRLLVGFARSTRVARSWTPTTCLPFSAGGNSGGSRSVSAGEATAPRATRQPLQISGQVGHGPQQDARGDGLLQEVQIVQDRRQVPLFLDRAGLGRDEADRALEALPSQQLGDVHAVRFRVEKEVQQKDVHVLDLFVVFFRSGLLVLVQHDLSFQFLHARRADHFVVPLAQHVAIHATNVRVVIHEDHALLADEIREALEDHGYIRLTGTNHRSIPPPETGLSTSKSRQLAFLTSMQAGSIMPASAAASSLKSGSWPTSATHASPS